MKKRLFLLVLATLTFTSTAFAGDVYIDSPVVTLGVQASGNQAYFRYNNIDTSCLYSYMYINTSTDGGKALYALVLSARVSGIHLARVYYTIDSNNKCTADIIQLATN